MLGDGRPLRAYWSKRERDWMIDSATRPSGHMMCEMLRKIDAELQDLDARGYDLTTLRFSIKQKQDNKPLAPAKSDG